MPATRGAAPKRGDYLMRIQQVLIGIAASAVMVSFAIATDPAGIVSNVIVAQGTASRINDHIEVGPWKLTLETQGESEFFYQDAVIGPGGRSGWHSHPGILLNTIKEGTVDWYDKDCVKHTYTAGQSFTEGAEPHNVLNPGGSNARALAVYVIKKGEPRRIESNQPPCAVRLQIP
jgi:quercetin dioxygenase-like cupin family protein